jgi:rod shape determining protein RodA
MIDKRLLKKLDYPILIIVIMLAAISILIISSAVRINIAETRDFHYVKMQLIWLFVGLAALTVVISIDYHLLERFVNVIYICNVILLLSVFLFEPVKGSQRWVRFGGFTLQPSEFAKIALIITLAKLLSKKHQDGIPDFKSLLPILAHVGLPMLIIIKQPDLGTSLVLVAILGGMLFMGGISYRLLAWMAAAGLVSAPVMWNFLKDYQKLRILVFINPEMDRLGSGYNVIQSMIAVGSGKLLGKGLFQGTQNQLGFLPEQQTDFIFSVLGEEFGFLGATVLLILYFILIMRCINIASSAKDTFGMLIIVGVATMLTFHVVVNIGMTIGIMPVTGLPLPFMSYGGSSFLANMIAIGLVLNIGMRRQKIRF